MTDERHELEDEFGAYLLGALSPEEERRVEELLETSRSARDRVRYMQPAVELLGEAVERREPPPELRGRILTEIGVDDETVAAPAERKPARRSWFSFGSFSLQPAMGFAAILLVAVVAVVGVVGYEVGTGGDGETTTAPHQTPSGTASLKINGDDGTLQLTGLTTLPPDQDYQAWVQRDGKMLPSSLFAVRKNGTASAAIPHDLDGAERVVVTAEPRGGSRVPTLPILASVSLGN